MKSVFAFLFVSVFLITGLAGYAAAKEEKAPKVGPVKLITHPASLEGKTVVLRWNGKFNGDKYLNHVGALLSKQVKNVKIVKLWETDKNTAAISKDLQASEQVAAAVAKLKADLVIAAQAD
jgi:hypothetical protein